MSHRTLRKPAIRAIGQSNRRLRARLRLQPRMRLSTAWANAYAPATGHPQTSVPSRHGLCRGSASSISRMHSRRPWLPRYFLASVTIPTASGTNTKHRWFGTTHRHGFRMSRPPSGSRGSPCIFAFKRLGLCPRYDFCLKSVLTNSGLSSQHAN